ncbi:MAG: hypothetical protein PHI58_04900 [Candidatus Omnitrophica bacterium]|nr:hypothetical protein [Candidatus Omnitrophota bacterium]
MKKYCLVLVVISAVALAGCESVSKPYIMTVDRVDQKVEGNKGYLKGTPPPSQERTGLTRPLIAVDMDLVSIQGKATKPTAIVTKDKASAASSVEEQTK